jgi:hypothetical protein
MANALAKAHVNPKSVERLGFYVLAPRGQIQAGIFGQLVSKESIRSKVTERVAQYAGARDTWFRESFEPLLEHIELGLLSWESVLERIASIEQGAFQEFYALCLHFNPQRPERAV